MARTTTVVFTDVTASSGILASLGDDRYASVFSAHVALLTAAAARHDGQVVKQLGDGVLALFSSAHDGVLAAIEMQQLTERSDRSAEGFDGLGLRVGVNVGDVVDAEDDIYGGAVVVARRLCDAAAPGQILVSDLVRLLAGNPGDLELETVGSLNLKGVPEPVSAYAVPWAALPEVDPLRVIVADDAALIRSGIVRLLAESGFEVLAEVGDGEALIAAVDTNPPDLVVTDIRMPPTNTDEGIRAAASIRAAHPDVAVLVLSQHIEPRAAASILDGRPAGIGYLLKERVSALDEFLAACHTVAAGGSVVDPIVAEQLLQRRRGDVQLARLSGREREVLELMAQGRSNGAIAEELHLGTKTVETHVRAIFQKLDLEETAEGSRRVQAVLRWMQTADGSGDATPD